MEMDVKRLRAREVHAQKVVELGLDPNTVDLTAVEAIAAALRRTASFLSPCTARSLVRGLVLPLRGLVEDLDAAKGVIEETLEAMVAHGDILQHHDVAGAAAHGGAELLYTAPAGFVVRESGTVILLGIASDGRSGLPDELEARIEYRAHVRYLRAVTGEDLRTELLQLGLIEIRHRSWLRAPPTETAARHLARLRGLLDEAKPSRDVPGLSLLDPSRDVGYYRGRWVEPRARSGCFVGRRRRAYGADLWCFVSMQSGSPERMIDLPVPGSRWRGCDEAWHLQMAIDAERGQPQRFRMRVGPEDTQVMEFLSPVPMWARRRWDAVGEPVSASRCLFAYRFAQAEVAEEIRFVRNALWLDHMVTDRGNEEPSDGRSR